MSTRDRRGDEPQALRTVEDWRAWDARRQAAPDRAADAAEAKAKEILRDEGFPEDWRAYAVTMQAADGRPLWACPPDERAQLLEKLATVDPDTRALGYEGPPLTLQADLARRALEELRCYRSARTREHALVFLLNAERMLAAVPLVEKSQVHAGGAAETVKRKAKKAAAHPTATFYDAAFAALDDDAKKKIGWSKFNTAAKAIAKDAPPRINKVKLEDFRRSRAEASLKRLRSNADDPR